MTTPRTISATELSILKVLWDHGPGTVRKINQKLVRRKKKWAYTTVLTLLQRLVEKGFVLSDKSGVAHVFRASLSRRELVGRKLTELVDSLCDGASTPIVQALVDVQDFTEEDVAYFHELLDKLEGPRKKRQRRNRG